MIAFSSILLGWRNVELVQGLPKVVHERSPLLLGDLKMAVRVAQGAARVLLRPASGLARQLGHVVLEPRRRLLGDGPRPPVDWH